METRWKAWMIVLVLAGPLMAFGGAESETGRVAEQILQEAVSNNPSNCVGYTNCSSYESTCP